MPIYCLESFPAMPECLLLAAKRAKRRGRGTETHGGAMSLRARVYEAFDGGAPVAVAFSVPPEILETLRRKLRISHSVLDVLVAQVVLNGPRIVPIIGELVAAGMPEHVGVNGEG